MGRTRRILGDLGRWFADQIWGHVWDRVWPTFAVTGIIAALDMLNRSFGFADPSHRGADLAVFEKQLYGLIDVVGKLGLVGAVTSGLVIVGKLIESVVGIIREFLDEIFSSGGR